MSKKATSSTENEETTETEIVSETVSAETVEETSSESVLNTSTTVDKTETTSDVNPKNATTKANKSGKMPVAKFLLLYPQDIYTATLLKKLYPRSVYTKDEWYAKIEEIKKTPITC